MIGPLEFSNIIICDDHYVSALGVEMLLRESLSQSAQIRTASNAKKALDLFDQQKPDLMLIDLDLPDLSGSELIQVIRSKSNYVPIIVLTGLSDQHTLRQIYQSKVNGILRKTSTRHHLQEALIFLKRTQDKTYLDPSVSAILKESENQTIAPREYEVLKWMAQGYTSDEIALQMDCSLSTVKTYRARIMNKTGAKNSSEMMAWYLKGNGKKDLCSAP